jgi:hypothetical protein
MASRAGSFNKPKLEAAAVSVAGFEIEEFADCFLRKQSAKTTPLEGNEASQRDFDM